MTIEDASTQEATALFNEVINSDLASLAERIAAGAPINFLGTCGEAPLHIAIYKRDDAMIHMLLDAGANIMFRNTNLDTALHVAARMGLSRVIQILYDGASALNKKRLFLDAKNRDGLTAFHIACMPVMHWELDLTRLYRSWDRKKDPSLDNEELPLRHGRIECREFLKDRMQEDVRNKEVGSVNEMVAQNLDFSRTAGILRGSSSSTAGARIYYSTLDYPAKLDANAWIDSDKKFFLEYLPGVREVMTKLHSADLVGKAGGSARANATLLQRHHEILLESKDGMLVTGADATAAAADKEAGNGTSRRIRGAPLQRGNLECESRGIGRVDEGLHKAPVLSVDKLRHFDADNHGDDVHESKRDEEGAGLVRAGRAEEGGQWLGTDGSMVYDLAPLALARAPASRTHRIDGESLDQRPSGSAHIKRSIEEQADIAVSEMLEKCNADLKEQRGKAHQMKLAYQEQMQPTVV